jgi:hypothetical protein
MAVIITGGMRRKKGVLTLEKYRVKVQQKEECRNSA